MIATASAFWSIARASRHASDMNIDGGIFMITAAVDIAAYYAVYLIITGGCL